jgi:hypothetical protein
MAEASWVDRSILHRSWYEVALSASFTTRFVGVRFLL